MSNEQYHIGVVAAGKRDILPGTEYDKLFPKPDNTNTLVDRNGSIGDTMFQMGKVLGKYYKDTAKLAPMLRGDTIEDTCKSIFDFVYNHIQYELDEPGEEQLRRPARAWADRERGVDCDCYSIFIASILMNLGIEYKLRITKYDGKPYYQHVYVIVPNGSGYYIIDPVLDTFNYEKQFSGHKDFTMTQLGIPISVLHGFEGTDTSIIDDLLSGGLGDNLDSEQAIYQHLIKTRETIQNNPGIIDSVDYAPGFLKMLDYAIENFNKGPKARAKAFEILAWNEAQLNKKMGVSQDDLDGINSDDDYIESETDVDNVELIDDDEVYHFDGVGNVAGLAGKKERRERKRKRQERRAKKRAEKKAKKAAKKAERKEEKAERKAERKAAKGFFRKIGVSLKQGGRAFVKFNPVVVAGRNGFLVALKTNMFKMASRLKWGYATDAQAKKAGISPQKHASYKRALKKVEQMFNDKLQGSKVSLKKAILSGKNALSGTADNYMSIDGLGAVEAGMVAAALPIIYGVVKVITDETGDNDAGIDPNASDTDNKTKVGKIIANLFKKKDSQQAFKDVEVEFDDLDDNNNDKPDGDGNFFTNIKGFAVANPGITIGIAAVGSYLLIPGVRNAVNGMFSGNKKTAEPKKQETTSGLGEVKAIKFN